MKKIVYILGLVIMLMIPQMAKGQYVQREGDRFTNQYGVCLTDPELINIVGPEVFTETVIGARKQYNAGSNLIWGGILAFGAGVTCTLCEVYDFDFGMILTETLLYGGGAALDAGLVLYFIGKNRLNWVRDYANTHNYSLNLGPTTNGVGLSIRF